MRYFFLLLFSFLFLAAWAQKTEMIYKSKTDSTQYYYKTLLPNGASRGLLVILGGFCTTPDEVMRETKLPERACEEGFTVVMPYLLDDCAVTDTAEIYQRRLVQLMPEWLQRYGIAANRVIVGGQSLGGHRALYYTEQAYKGMDKKLVQPAAVFGVDPPLDMKRLWHSFTYGVTIGFSEVSIAEGREMLKRFKKIYGGSPEQKPGRYEALSSYFHEAKDGGNAKYLKTIPVRLYCDPDINWMIENRRGSYATMNATDVSGCISRLKLLGNSRAEFINCLGKGFKPDGTRHPHYFSMLDVEEFISWANRILESKK
jgi:hypothetical protein